ncbi:hypothetical protein ANN_00559 [Periplaneta americana]|uniref:Uncharacterized protein n=1 Tax=Periplaneta americana TaxID=6978 RepID=A0ABQ8TTJ9_PERAM|nr:hypothetical protein ANN_00559 [Periplaneta americana]
MEGLCDDGNEPPAEWGYFVPLLSADHPLASECENIPFPYREGKNRNRTSKKETYEKMEKARTEGNVKKK